MYFLVRESTSSLTIVSQRVFAVLFMIGTMTSLTLPSSSFHPKCPPTSHLNPMHSWDLVQLSNSPESLCRSSKLDFSLYWISVPMSLWHLKKMEFTYHYIHNFKVGNTVGFSTFTELCIHNHIFENIFSSPEKAMRLPFAVSSLPFPFNTPTPTTENH